MTLRSAMLNSMGQEAGVTETYPDYPDVVLAIVIVDCEDPDRLGEFWGALLGRKHTKQDETYTALEWAPRFGAGMVFQKVSEPKTGKNRVHPDIICADREATATRVEELGGKLLLRAESFIVMADPEGNEFCLIPSPA